MSEGQIMSTKIFTMVPYITEIKIQISPADGGVQVPTQRRFLLSLNINVRKTGRTGVHNGIESVKILVNLFMALLYHYFNDLFSTILMCVKWRLILANKTLQIYTSVLELDKH